MWDLKQRNFFCVRLRPHSLWTQAGKRSTLGCGCRDSLYTGLGAALLSLPMSLSSGSRHRGGERVTYLDLLNSFHQWQKSNYLPGNARLLYYGLLAVFNEARWPEQVQIDNFRLMSMLDTRTERVAIAARDSLVAAGLIEYSRGKKRSPNTYRLKYTPQKVSENGSESPSLRRHNLTVVSTIPSARPCFLCAIAESWSRTAQKYCSSGRSMSSGQLGCPLRKTAAVVKALCR